MCILKIRFKTLIKGTQMQYFTKKSVKFLTDLAQNNSKEWFEQNRSVFNESIMEPAKEFVEALGGVIRDFCPDVKAIPKTDKSIFRMHRDTRFSQNKNPYKNNLGIYFWEGERKKMECSGFYFHIEPKHFFMGSGMYMFPKDILKQYRRVVAKELPAKELNETVKKLIKKYDFELGGKYYKKIPRGFTIEHNYPEYILFNGLWIGTKSSPVKKFLEIKDQVAYVNDLFKKMAPIHNWLMENVY